MEPTYNNPTIENMRAQLAKQEFCYVRYPKEKKFLLDTFTMSALVQLHDAMNEEARAKLIQMVSESRDGLLRAVDFCMRKAK